MSTKSTVIPKDRIYRDTQHPRSNVRLIKALVATAPVSIRVKEMNAGWEIFISFLYPDTLYTFGAVRICLCHGRRKWRETNAYRIWPIPREELDSWLETFLLQCA